MQKSITKNFEIFTNLNFQKSELIQNHRQKLTINSSKKSVI